MKRRLPPILMTLVLVCALPIWAAFVTSGDVTNPLLTTADATSPPDTAATRLKSAISNGGTVQLTEDIEISETLLVTRDVTLDLNGHVLKMTGSGSVLYVKEDGPNTVTLTITDSRPQNPHTGSYVGLPAGGVITGGTGTRERWTSYTLGGAVFLWDGMTLKLEGGTLTGSSSDSSVFIRTGATFVMTGGTITGENVGVHNNVGTFTMTGGRITGCSYRGVYVYNGNMTMSGTAYIGGNDTNQYPKRADIYVHEPVRKVTGLSVTGGIIEGKVYIFFETSNMKPDGESRDDDYNVKALKSVAESVVKGNGVLDGHIQVKMDDGAGTSVDYNTVNFIDEVAKTRTFQPIFANGDNKKARKPDDPAIVNGQAFMYWAAKGTSEAWNFDTEINESITLYAVRTPASSGDYYYYPTTDTKADDAKGSPKTADPGAALYGALALLSLTGLTCTARKKF